MVEPLAVVRVWGEGARLVKELGVLMVYSRWVRRPRGLEAGRLVVAEDEAGDVIGCGFYDNVGPVALRLVQLGDCSFASAEEAIRARLEQALRQRRLLGLVGPRRGYRLVHSDGDLLPGLIVDVYDDIVVYQSSSIVWDIHANTLVEALRDLLEPATVYEKSTQRTRRDIGLEPRETTRYGKRTRTVIEEGNALFTVDVKLGQKTGFFLDQSLNRLEAEKYVEPGAMVLDVFSYTGGFGIHALVAGARQAVFIEEDERALQLLRENLRLNRVEEKAEIIADNAWQATRRLLANKKTFNTVFVDPPAFIPSQDAKKQGMDAYYHIYKRALQLLNPPGILFYSSCSTFLTRGEFTTIIARVMASSKADYTPIGGIRGASPDHPPRPSSPHLDYLKAAYILVHENGKASARS